MPLTAVSPDKSILAVYNHAQASSSSKILIKCYDAKVSLGTLKFTLSAKNESASSTINKISFASSQFLVASTEEGPLLVFDLDRGVLSQTIEVASSLGKVVCIATHEDHLYVLSNNDGKTLVIVYDLSQNAKIIKKIKTGSCDQDDPVAIDVASDNSDSNLIAVRLGKKIKLVDSNNGSVRGKFKIKNSDSEAVDSPFVCLSSDAKFLAVNTSNSLSYFIMDGDGECKSLGTSALPNISNADICIDNDSGRYVVSATDKSTTSLLSIKVSGSKKSNVKPFAFMSEPVAKDNTAIDAFFSSEELIMAELSTKGLQNVNVNLVRVSWNGASGNLYPTEEGGDNGDENKSPSKKRKANSKNVVIGPGESGGEALTVIDSTKRTKRGHDGDDSGDEVDDFVLEDVDDEEGESTIAQRLALLSSELDRDDDEEDLLKFQRSTAASGTFVAKAATSDSLVILLRQALLANDDAQLEVALQVSDKKVIENSIMALSSDEVNSEGDNGEVIVMLLTKLVTRLSRKPARAQQLSFWIRTVLVALISSSNDGTMKMGKAEKDIAARLAPLRSMLSERVESLPALLRLEGRLGLLGKQF